MANTKQKNRNTSFSNKQAFFHYAIDNTYVAGVALLGTEVKSIRDGKVSFNDSYCMLDKGELWMRGVYIAEYNFGTTNNHIAVHDRKLLLHKKELKKIESLTKEKGITIVPLKIFINDRSFVKVEIGIGKGKKLYDKRETIKQRDNDKELKRYLKN
jgi:SsrA-binding protein